MANMVVAPHHPPHQVAAKTSGGNASASVPRTVGRVQGWSEGNNLNVHSKAVAARMCMNTSCVNVLKNSWPLKYCAPCQEVVMMQKVNVPCSSCYVTPLCVTRREAGSGAQFICNACWRGMNARIPVAVPMVKPRTQTMPPPPMQPSHPPAPPPAPVAAPQQAADVFELIKKYVHPDHRHVLERRDEGAPLPPIKPLPVPRALNYDEARRRAQSVMPHYGVHGGILAITPDDMQRGRAVPFTVPTLVPNRPAIPPPAAAQPPEKANRTPSGSVPRPILPKVEKTAMAVEAPDATRLASEKLPVANAISVTDKSSEVDAPPPPIRKKRKRAVAPVPPPALAERLCATPECSRTIPPKIQGVLCVQCGFARWQNQFRERFANLRAELSPEDRKDKDKENKAPAPTKEPVVATVADAPNASEVSDAVEVGASPTPLKVDVAIPQVDSIPPPSPTSSDPLPPAVEMPLEQSRELPEQHEDAMDVDHDSSDDEPLSARIRRPSTSNAQEQSAMVVDPLTSDEEPLSAMVTRHEDASSDEEPLSARLQGYASSDEEPLAKVVSARASASPQKLSAAHAASGTSSSTYAPLRIVIPPLSHPAPPRIRRVRLILGPRPPTPDSSASSRESSPERTSVPLYTRRRTSSAIDERWLALGWDSDESELTPLEESTDEGESEIDPAESEDEAPAPVAAGPSVSNGSPSHSKQQKKPASPTYATGKKHRGQCATAQCTNLLLPGWKWKSCDICRLRTRILRKQQRRAAAALAPKEIEEFELPADGDMTGWQKCSRASCKRMMPERYQYKRCPRCRAYARRQRERERYGPEGLPDDEALLFAASGTQYAQPAAVINAGGGGGMNEAIATSSGSVDAEKDCNSGALEDLPPYQHFASLLGTLRQRFDDFRAAQVRYVQLKALQGAERKPMVFGFDGEYSIVADPSGGSVDAIVNTVIRNLSFALDLVFTLVGVRPGPEDSIIAALRCLYKPRISALRTKQKTDSEPKSENVGAPEPKKSSVVEVTMTGDLEIGVAWDRRHKFFPGQRIMVRFRLFG